MVNWQLPFYFDNYAKMYFYDIWAENDGRWAGWDLKGFYDLRVLEIFIDKQQLVTGIRSIVLIIEYDCIYLHIYISL